MYIISYLYLNYIYIHTILASALYQCYIGILYYIDSDIGSTYLIQYISYKGVMGCAHLSASLKGDVDALFIH